MTYFPEMNYTIFLNKKLNRPMISFKYRFGIYALHVKQQKIPLNKKKVSTDLIYAQILQQNSKPVQYGCLHRQIQKANKNIVPALIPRHKKT